MDNEKLAKAIVALYSVSNSDVDKWDDADEAINNAAFLLFEKVDCGAIDFGVMLVKNGMSQDFVQDFCDVSARTLGWACREAGVKPF